jgi:uncharacterized protein (TIGR02996 family)
METALRTAICEAPNDDLPKLVFADWLEEECRVIEAMFIRHYVSFGEINYGPMFVRGSVMDRHYDSHDCGGSGGDTSNKEYDPEYNNSANGAFGGLGACGSGDLPIWGLG